MSNNRTITQGGFTNLSNDRVFKVERAHGVHKDLPVRQSIRGEQSNAIPVGGIEILPVRITESIQHTRTAYGNAVAKLFRWGGKEVIETEHVGVIDDGTVVHGNERHLMAIEETMEPRPERLGPSTLLIVKNVHEVRADLFSMRHELGLAIDGRSIESVRRSFEEDIHPGLPYTIEPDGVPAGFTYDGKTGIDAAEAFLETEVNVHEIWKRLCALVDRTTPLPSFKLCLNTDNEKMGAATFKIVDIHFEKHMGRRRATSFSSTSMRRLSLSLNSHQNDLEEFECTLVHELGHMLTNGLPLCEMLREGMAEAIVALYSETYDRPFVRTNGTPSMRPAAPGASIGQRTPTCAQPIEHLHTAVGWAGASMFLDVLGTTTDERLENLRHLVAASSETSNGTPEEHVLFRSGKGVERREIVRKLPTVDEWLQNVDRAQPGLGRAIATHPVMQPIGPKGIAAFYPDGSDGPWGTITAFSFQPNDSFGYAKPNAPHHSESTDDYDWNAGTATPTTVDICVTSKDMQYEHRGTGIVPLTPPMLCMEMKVPLNAFENGVTVEYRIGDGEWVCAGENVKLGESDQRAYHAWKAGLNGFIAKQAKAVLNPPRTAVESEKNEGGPSIDDIFSRPSTVAELTSNSGHDAFFASHVLNEPISIKDKDKTA